MRHLLLSIACWLIWVGLHPPLVSAQYESLNPEHWFPLDLGNYWHYRIEDSGLTQDVVLTSDQEKLVNGERWVRFTEIFCQGPSCTPGWGNWYRFSEDHYLLHSYDLLGRVDTLWHTLPTSIFDVVTTRDTLIWKHEGNIQAAVISILQHDQGHVADSTHLILHFDGNIFLQDAFIYNLGRSKNLVGASVNGITYGDISLLDYLRVATEEPDRYDLLPLQLQVFPSPTHVKATIAFVAPDESTYDIRIYNVLGQQIMHRSQPLIRGQRWEQAWPTGEQMPSGVYYVTVGDKRHALSQVKTLHLVR